MSKHRAGAQNNVHLAIRNGESERPTVTAAFSDIITSTGNPQYRQVPRVLTIYRSSRKKGPICLWVPLLACPAVSSMLALLDKPAVAPKTIISVYHVPTKRTETFENRYGSEGRPCPPFPAYNHHPNNAL